MFFTPCKACLNELGLPILHSGSYHFQQLQFLAKKKNEMAPPLSCTLMQTYAPTNLQIFLLSVCMKHHLLLLLAKDGLLLGALCPFYNSRSSDFTACTTNKLAIYGQYTAHHFNTNFNATIVISTHNTLTFLFICNFPKGQVYLCTLLSISPVAG